MCGGNKLSEETKNKLSEETQSDKVYTTIHISSDLMEELRKLLPARKGALKKFIEEAIKEKLDKIEAEKK
jgi:hypothetical protein